MKKPILPVMTSLTIAVPKMNFGIKAMSTHAIDISLHHNKQTMLLVICLFGFVISTSLGAPAESPAPSSPEPVAILSSESDVDPNGNYKYR